MNRDEMIEAAAEAIRRRSEQIGETVGWTGDLDTEFAAAAVDVVLDAMGPPF